MTVNIIQRYACELHSRRHTNIRCLRAVSRGSHNPRRPRGQNGRRDVQDRPISLPGQVESQGGRDRDRATRVNETQDVGRTNPPAVSQKEVQLYKAKLARARPRRSRRRPNSTLPRSQHASMASSIACMSFRAAWSGRGTSSRPCPITKSCGFISTYPRKHTSNTRPTWPHRAGRQSRARAG